MGRVIRAWRCHPHHGRPISQERLAQWVGITQPHLSRIETRHPPKNLDYLAYWAVVLGIPAERLWFSLPGRSAPPAITALTTSSSPVSEVEVLPERLVAGAAADSARFAQRVEASNVGGVTIDQLFDDLTRIAVQYPAVPLAPLFLEVVGLRDQVFELLDGHQYPCQTTDLYYAGGLACAVLSNVSFDVGAFAAARAQARAAFVCAELAGSNWLRAWVRGMQALIAYWTDEPGQAVALTSDGWGYAPEHGTARVRLAAIEARAHARVGGQRDAELALARADRARDRVTEPGICGVFHFPEAKQLFYAANCHLTLNRRASDPRTAEDLASRAVAWYDEQVPAERRRIGEQSLARLELAFARVEQHDIPDSAEVIRHVIDATTTRPTSSVIRHLARFTNHLDTLAPTERPAALLAGDIRQAIDLNAPIDLALAPGR